MPQLNHHSEEIQEIMGRIPGWIIRWGITLIFMLFIVLLLVSYFIKYPEQVSAPIVITTENPPADLIARSTGKIDILFVKEGDKVAQDSIVAILFNTANYPAVFELEKCLDNFGDDWPKYLSEEFTERTYQAGGLQSSLSQLTKACRMYRHYLESGHIPQKQKLLRAQIETAQGNLSNLRRQVALLETDRQMAADNHRRDSILRARNTLSLYDYQQTVQSLNQKDITLINQRSTIKQVEGDIYNLEGQIVELDIQQQSEVNSYIVQISDARDQLAAQIKQWRDQYVLYAPVSGTVTFTKYWSENQNITAGERLATVIPEGETIAVGKMFVPSASFGKVKVGQNVHIKLNGYPYMEFGMLRGKLASVSAIPETEGYAAEVHFPNGLISTYKKEFNLIQQMDGTGDIVTRDMRLIERFFQQVRNLIDNNI